MSIVYLNSENFEQWVLESNLPVLIDFMAQWCNPCRRMAPIVEELADELDGEIDICQVDVDEAGEIIEKYSVMSVPTFILFKNGKEHARIAGLFSKAEILEFIAQGTLKK